jgi:hypothetical protein
MAGHVQAISFRELEDIAYEMNVEAVARGFDDERGGFARVRPR